MCVAAELPASSAHNTTDSACWCHRASPSRKVAVARGCPVLTGPKIARITSCLPAIAKSRVSCGRGCIVTLNRSIVGAFRDDGMRLHAGDGRVVARARRDLDGQVTGTDFRHASLFLPASPVRSVTLRVVRATFDTCLMKSFGRAVRAAPTASAAVDIPAVVGRAEINDSRAASAGNPHKTLDIHARTETPRSSKLPAPSAFGQALPVCVHARHEGSGYTPGPSLLSAARDFYSDQ